jgi:uroporphyrinogen-III synthase
LRPEPGASETVRKARQLGLHAVAIPLFEIKAVEWQAPDPHAFDGLLLTSANAIRFGGEALDALRNLPVYAVGDATASVAREAGFTVAVSGDSGVERLLESIPSDLRLLHLCGADRKETAGAIRKITPIVVYCSKPAPAPGVSDLGEAVALIHSPRAGRRFAELVRDRSSLSIVAISPAAADAVGLGWRSIEAAARPSDDALLALAARLCNNPAPK